MSLLKTVEPGGAYLKVGIFGGAGSGKTFTATNIAVGTRAFFGLTGPIAYFDTENGTPYVEEAVARATGTRLLAHRGRALSDLKAIVRECVEVGASVLIVDSMTHVWDEVKETYLRELNEARKQNRQGPLDRLEFHHWAAIKAEPLWGGWTNLLLNSPLHIIVCGRAGKVYEYQENDAGKKELITTGVKMKAEGDFGYEPSLVFEMSAEQVMDKGRVERIDNYALILKDRFNVINGKTLGPAPTFEHFLPHVQRLRPTMATGVDTDRKTPMNLDASGDGAWQRERRQREIVLEELTAELDKAGLGGTSNEAKKARPILLEKCFGTASRTKLEGLSAAALREGLARVREEIPKVTTKEATSA